MNYLRSLSILGISILLFSGLKSLSDFAQPAGPPTVAQLSCAPTGGSPLTKTNIEARAIARGISTDPNTMGRAFENFVLDSIGDVKNTNPTIRFYSAARQAATKNYRDPRRRHSFVVPDALGPIIVRNRDQYGRIISVSPYTMSAFEEMKFKRGVIYMSSFEHQITGMVSVLGTTSAAALAVVTLPRNRPTPRLTFHTPSDLSISQSIIDGANRVRVGIWQQVACDNPGGQRGVNDMQMGQAVLLNPTVYLGSAPPTRVPSGKPSTLQP
jgi:hypothetical protein